MTQMDILQAVEEAKWKAEDMLNALDRVSDMLVMPLKIQDVKIDFPIYKINEPVPSTRMAASEEWKPEYWVERGYQRCWGDAAVMSDYFEILKKCSDDPDARRKTHFVILCPTFLRRPLKLDCEGYAHGSY